MPLDDAGLINNRYSLYLCRNSLDWSGSQYLEARAEFYSLLLKLLLGEYIQEVCIVTDNSMFKNFYEKWNKELNVSFSDTLKIKLSYYVVGPDRLEVKHELILDAEDTAFLGDQQHKNMRSDNKSRHLSEWYERASLFIGEIIENQSELSDHVGSIPESVYCYQKTQDDLIVLIEQ